MYQATFTLRQETPLIHFLHDQPGATLRATELKPKLDRFILGDFLKINPKATMDHKETIKNLALAVAEKKTSAYQMVIEHPNSQPDFYYFESRFTKREKDYLLDKLKKEFNRPDLKVIEPSPFFANNDKRKDWEKGKKEKWPEVRLGLFYKGEIKIHIKTWDNDLLDLINVAFPLLFCVENFGMRQSKGFGCFRETSVSNYMLNNALKSTFDFCKKKSANLDFNFLFKHIDDVYKLLRNKAGANNSNPNEPSEASAIRDYFEEQNPSVEWEKYSITNKLVFEDDYNSENEVRFVRALLGLPGLHDYPQTREKVKVQIEDSTQDKDKKIERYRSPILFKVYNGLIYLLAKNIDPKMLDHEFTFYVGENKESNPRRVTLFTPPQFSIVDFLNKKLPSNWQNI